MGVGVFILCANFSVRSRGGDRPGEGLGGFVRNGVCPHWVVFQNWRLSKSPFVRIGVCPNRRLSERFRTFAFDALPEAFVNSRQIIIRTIFATKNLKAYKYVEQYLKLKT
jgi:hypothetical protein